jgi:cystathionine beta-lyase/cystathionine gamma-synthase
MREPGHGLRGHLVRFSVGLESVKDLVADLDRALGESLRAAG